MIIESFRRCVSSIPSSSSYLVFIVVCFMGIACNCVYGQENAQTRIPNSLAECYEIPEIYDRDNRLPATINTVIEIIRKIEDAPGYTQDLRQIATGILHRFRLDGIERAPGVYQRSVLPFSPSGYQFSKHRLLLSRLIPGNANNFPNNTLTIIERCTLHFLISSSIESQVRGDEATRCGQLAQFRSMRIPNDVSNSNRRKKRHNRPQINNYLCDLEMVSDRRRCQRAQKKSNRYSAIGVTLRNGIGNTHHKRDGDEDDVDEEPDISESDYPDIFGNDGLIDVASNAISQCPVENGVIRTTWGAVSLGPLLAGIAAGLVQQNVATRELLLLTKTYLKGRSNGRQQVQLVVDNRWAATLAGDLAEVALLQGPVAKDVSVGAPGAWNSTTVPHWYFLSQRERLEMTDAEIRGGIDGLVLATNILNWRNQASQLRLSQILDMYYSQRGVFSTQIRSCNRRELFTQVAPLNQLQAQTIAFSTVLDREMQLRVTLTNEAIQQFSNAASEALVSHVASGLNDVSCDATSSLNSTLTSRTAADLHIFVDTTWQFMEIQPIIAALLESLDVNKFGSRCTLYTANDATIIVNTTSSLSDFYSLWNQPKHQEQKPGLDLKSIVKQIHNVGLSLLDEERAQSSVGGSSLIALVLPQMAGVNEGDSDFALNEINLIHETVPDCTLLFWAGGSHGRFSRFVRDQQEDLFQLIPISSVGADSGHQILTAAQPVIQRIQSVPRKIINPRCGANWQQDDSGSNTMEQYVEPSGVNFYRLHPNYFFGSGGVVQILGRGYSQVAVCSSRSVERPRFRNTSQAVENVDCRQLLATDNYQVDLGGACSDHSLIQNCPPVYISVEGVPLPAGQTNFRCNEAECRFPDSIKFGISIDKLGCFSGAAKLISYATITVLSIAISCYVAC